MTASIRSPIAAYRSTLADDIVGRLGLRSSAADRSLLGRMYPQMKHFSGLPSFLTPHEGQNT